MPAAAVPSATDVLVVGAGPAGSAAAAWAARAGHDVVLADAAVFPRDKTCGDGLTPRAIAELDLLGLGDWVRGHARNRGLRAAGFGQEWQLPWPGGRFPDHGSAVPRTELDARIREVALDVRRRRRSTAPGRSTSSGTATGSPPWSSRTPTTSSSRVACRRLVVADGVRSPLGRVLGREWHRDTAYGVAARGYVRSGRSDDEWISSHLELRGAEGELLSGYGWVFPLGAAAGEVNIGVGTLATARRPAGRAAEGAAGDLHRRPPRGVADRRARCARRRRRCCRWAGRCPGVAGRNWALIGDAAGCVNPLNGEGIDYGLETGRIVVDLFGEDDWSTAWPATLRRHYGEAFSIARRLAGLLTVPRLLPAAGPVGMRSRALMTVALRVMGNLVTDEDRDVVARAWRLAGRLSVRLDDRPPFS